MNSLKLLRRNVTARRSLCAFAVVALAFPLALAASVAPSAPSSATPPMIGLFKDGQLLETWAAPAAVDATVASARELAASPEAFGKLISTELATEAAGQPTSPEVAARQQALRRSAQSLEDLRAIVRELRAGDRATWERRAGELQERIVQLPAVFATTSEALEGIGQHLKQYQLPAEIVARHQAAVAATTQSHAALVEALRALQPGNVQALLRAESLLDQLASPDQPKPQVGPTVATELRPAPELTREEADARLAKNAASSASRVAASSVEFDENVVVESASSPPVAADLAATIEIPLSADIIAQATALGNSPQRIFEFVRGQIGFQPYLGSRKGAEETLRQRNGNDTDQASLLIALLRAAGIPSRYVRGTVEMTPARAMSWLGVDHAATAGSILTTAGLDGVNIVDGSTVAAIRCTRVWVEAWVPYSNYRGVPNSAVGSAWVPLDPAFKGTSVTPGQDVLASMGFNTDTFLDSYISTFHPLSPVEQFVANVQTYLNGAQPGTTVAQIERSTAINAPALGLLPASLPNELRAVSSRFSELEDSKRYKVRFRLYNGATTFIDYTTNLSQIAGHRVTFDYVGATPADQTTIDSFGGVYQTPPNLVNVKPRLKLDGNVLVTSANAIGLARTHNTDMHFTQPVGASNVQPLIQNTIIAGNSQAIAFDTFLDTTESGLFPSSLPSPGLLESLLHSTAAEYLSRVDRGMEQAGRILRVVTTQDVSEAIVESAVKVSYSFGVPVTFEWGGLIVDADRRIVGTFAVDGNAAKHVPYMKLTGYDGSTMENRVFEDLYNQRAVSTIKILELSSDMGIPWYRITTSIAADAPGLSQPASVVSAINNALAQGHHVIVPRTGITVGQWSGTGYIDLTPSTGAAGYIISGGISGAVATSGGATVDVWPISLACMPIGAVTGTITPDNFAPNDVLCPNLDQISYTVQLEYDCKKSTGAIEHKVFGPTSHTVPKPNLRIVETYGGGVYTISIPGTSVTPVKFTLLDVESVKPDKGTEIDDKDGDPNTKTYVVAASTTAGDKITVTAKPKPDYSEGILPACWSLTGGTGTGKLTRTVDQTAPATTLITATSGLRVKKTKIVVLKIEFSKAATEDAAGNTYGYDNFDTPADTKDDHVSVKSVDGTTYIKVVVSGTTDPTLVSIKSTDDAKAKADPLPDPIPAAGFLLKISGKAAGDAKIEGRAGGDTGTVVAEIATHTYKQKTIAKWSIYRVTDSSSAGTSPVTAITAADAKTFANGITKQGVVHFADAEIIDKDIAYDLNGNGSLEWFYDGGAQTEYAVITAAGLAGNPKIAMVKSVNFGWRLSHAAAVGDTKIKLIGAQYIADWTGGGYAYVLGLGANSENVTLSSVTGLEATLSAPLAKAHAAGVAITADFGAGVGADPQIVEDGAAVKTTLLHETMHRPDTTNLLDLISIKNVMHFSTGVGHDEFRYLGQPLKYSGGTENQWDTVPRP